MFTLGVLSSHLPYVAFVAFYLFYLIYPAALHHQEQVKDPQIPGEKMIVYADHLQLPDIDEKTTAFYTHKIVKAAEKQKATDVPSYQLIIKIPISPVNIQLPTTAFCFARFSRPPPVL